MPENKQTASLMEEEKNTVKQSAFLTDGHWGSLHLKGQFTPEKKTILSFTHSYVVVKSYDLLLWSIKGQIEELY